MLAKSPTRAHARAIKKRIAKISAARIAPDPFADAAAGRDPPAATLLDGVIASAARKGFPITSGFLDYFPDAVAAAAEASFLGNQKHNPGEKLRHARDKSADHADCIARHLMQRGGFETITIDGVEHKVRHSVALFWRAGALAQEELENEMGYALARGALPPR